MPSVCWQHNPLSQNIAKPATVDFKVKWNHLMKDKWDATKKAYNYNFYQDFYEKVNAEFILCDKDRTNKANMIYEIYSTYTGLD